MSAATETKAERPKIRVKVEHIAAGRARVSAVGGVLDHIDQLQVFSDRQRLRFAQACAAKLEGCEGEVLGLLEREAISLQFKVDPKTDDCCRILFTPAAKFMAEPVDWIWQDRIPAGSVTILEGDPGVGKSLLLVDLAARVSRGFLAPDRQPAFDEPGHDPEPYPGLVWWFSGHDHPERTLTPRLAAAGADMNMVRIAEGIEDQRTEKFRPIQFPQDFNSLRKSRSESPRLVIVDPLSSFCGGSLHLATNHKVLTELSRFAAETGAAVIVVRPLNRRAGATASERGSAGPTLTAEARSALLLAVHPEDPSKRVLAVVKSNLSAIAPSLELEITTRRASESHLPTPRGEVAAAAGGGDDYSRVTETDPRRLASSPPPPAAGGGHDAGSFAHLAAPIISWHGEVLYDANELVRGGWKSGASKQRTAVEQKKVEEWLNEKLAAGPKLVREIDQQALLDEVPPALLRRAKISLGVVPSGSNGRTKWRLPNFELDETWRDNTLCDELLENFKPRRAARREPAVPNFNQESSPEHLETDSDDRPSRHADAAPLAATNLNQNAKSPPPASGGGGEPASRWGLTELVSRRSVEQIACSPAPVSPVLSAPTRRGGDLPPRRGEVCEEGCQESETKQEVSSKTHPSPPTPLPQGERGDEIQGERGEEEIREELRDAARDLRRRIVNSDQWKRMVANGEIPERLPAVAEADRQRES